MWFIKLYTRRQILDSSKLKEFADDNFRFDENGGKFSERVEKTVGKGEIAVGKGEIGRYKQFFSFFSTEFSRDFSCRHIKKRGLFGEGLTLYQTIPHCNDSGNYVIQKYCGKRRKMLVTNKFPFPKLFSIHTEILPIVGAIFDLSTARSLNFDRSKILSSGKDFNYLGYHQIYLVCMIRIFWHYLNKLTRN